MKKLILLTKVCLLVLSLGVFGPSKSNAQGQLTLTNIDGVPLYIFMPPSNGLPVVGLIVNPSNPNSTNWQQQITILGLDHLTNIYVGGPLHLEPGGEILVIPTNITVPPALTLSGPFLSSPFVFGLISTTNRSRVTFQWLTIPGAEYQVQRSIDQIHWTTFKRIMGTGGQASVGNYPIGRWLHYRVITDWFDPHMIPFPPTEVTYEVDQHLHFPLGTRE